MRSSTSFAILALLATAGTSFGAPVYRDTSKRDDQLTNIRVGNDKVVNGKPINVGPLPDLDKPLNAHSADSIHPVTGQKNPALVNVVPITNDKHLKDDKVAVLPNDKLVPGKDGIVDVQQGNLAGHVIQTPGKDKTIADVQVGDGNPAHKTDVKLNLPADGPAGGLAGTAGNNDQAGNLVSQLVGTPGKGPKQIVGLEPLAEVNTEGQSKPPTPAPSSAKPASHPSSSAKPPPKASSAKSSPARSSAPAPSASNAAKANPSASASPRPAHSNAPSHGTHSASHSHSSAPHSSSPAPKPSQSAKANDDGDDDGGLIQGGAFRPTRPGKDQGGKDDHHSQTDNKGGKGPNRIDNNGDGHVIGLSSSTRRGTKPIDLKVAQVQIGNLPEHVRPCDTHRHGANGQLVDACIEADLLAYAPKHTFRCPDELQHEIHIHEDTAKDATLNTKLGKEIAKYVRLCVDVGAL